MGRRRVEITKLDGYYCSACDTKLIEMSDVIFVCPNCGCNYYVQEDEFDEDNPEFEYYDPMDDY